MSRLDIFSLVLDGQPMILFHLPILNALPPDIDWHWWIIHGQAAAVNCSKWCKSMPPRLSRDGTGEYLNSLIHHPRITVIQKQFWDGGKVQMCSAATSRIQRETVLLQVDVDEFYSTEQLVKLVKLFADHPDKKAAWFYCNFMVGPNIVVTPQNDAKNNFWIRAWRFKPGMTWISHEPPRLKDCETPYFTREETRAAGLVFFHYAYCFASQILFKQNFYGYKDALVHWQRLQANKKWPVKLKEWLPWAKDGAVADLLWK